MTDERMEAIRAEIKAVNRPYWKLLCTAVGAQIIEMQVHDELSFDPENWIDNVEYPTKEAAQQGLAIAVTKAVKILTQCGYIVTKYWEPNAKS